MIRINLLQDGRKPVAARQKKAVSERADIASLTMAGVALLGVLLGLGMNYWLGRTLAAKKEEVAEAQREVDELAPIIREVEEFKARKVELERKVRIINDLKANQLGPVRILDYVSRALPQLLWLTRMDVRAATISISGEAFNTNAVANFMENLDRVPEFREPTLRDTAQRGTLYTFSIDVPYSFGGSSEAGEASEDG